MKQEILDLEFDILNREIKRFQKGIKKQDCRVVRALNAKVIARKSILCIKESIDNFHSTQQAAVGLGREILRGLEDRNEPEEKRSIRRFKIGLDLIYLFERLGYCREQFMIKTNPNTKKQKGMYYLLNAMSWKLNMLYDFYLLSEFDVEESVHFQPQFEKPEDWTSSRHPVFGDLVRHAHPDTPKFLTRRRCRRIYSALNKLQSTSLSVDTEMLQALLKTLDKPIWSLVDKNYSMEQRESIWKDAYDVLTLAEKIGDRTFWTGYFLDFRYRVYPTMSRLNLVSSPLAKSLIRFGEKKRLTNEGVTWLKVQIANCMGYDKLPLDERVIKVDEAWDTLESIAIDPVNEDGWTQFDDPFNGLAAILELYRHFSDPTYESGAMVAFDATTSGAMVLAALVRDEKGMKLTNIYGNDDIADLYQTVVNRAYTLLSPDSWWHQHRARSRKLGKRVIMTVFYSCGPDTAAEAILTDFAHEPWMAGLTKELALEWTKALHQACRIEMPKVMAVMDKFVEYAATFSDKYEDATWVVPSTGARVLQYYRYNDTKRIFVRKNGVAKQYKIITTKNRFIAGRDAATGIAPNITHSLDASLVHWLIDMADYSILTIHDSFMSHPNDSGSLFEDVRTSLKEILPKDTLEKVLDGRVESLEVADLEIGAEDNDFCFS